MLMDRAITYGDLDALSRQFAAWLQQVAGLKKGDRVAIMLPNVLQYPVAMFGALRAGLTVVNTNPLYTPRELAHQLKDSGARRSSCSRTSRTRCSRCCRATRVKT